MDPAARQLALEDGHSDAAGAWARGRGCFAEQAVAASDDCVHSPLLTTAKCICTPSRPQPHPYASPHPSPHPNKNINQARRVTPHIEVVADGSEGAQLFESLLIDDPDPEDYESSSAADPAAGGGGGGGQQQQLGGRAGFEQHVRAEVALTLQPE